MKRFFLCCIALLILQKFTIASSDTTHKKGIAGGMFYGLGRFSLENNFTKTNTNSNVIGGRLGYFFSKNFFAGIMGNSSTLHYQNQSYLRYTYFGLASELKIPYKRMAFSPGIWIGGGIMRNLHIENLENGKITDGYIHKYYSLFAYPYFNISYKATKKLNLHLISEYIHPQLNNSSIQIHGSNIRIGLMFQR
jgi:hypothetical protein